MGGTIPKQTISESVGSLLDLVITHSTSDLRLLDRKGCVGSQYSLTQLSVGGHGENDTACTSSALCRLRDDRSSVVIGSIHNTRES